MSKPLGDEVSKVCNSLLESKPRIRMLEAGCGSASHVRFRPVTEIVGLDISSDQLARNHAVHEKILGDIQDYHLPKDEFDVVVCWWVMEHLSRPKDAMLNMFGAVKPEGLLILAFPNVLSYKGIVTKFTPLWVHRLYYDAMKFKTRPFPTFLRMAILPKNVVRFSRDNGFSLVYFKLVEGNPTIRQMRAKSRLVDFAVSVVTLTLQTVSFGKLDSLLCDHCVMVLRKGRVRSSA